MRQAQGFGTGIRARDRVVLFDLDGTLCDHAHRLPLITGLKKKNYVAYHEAMGEDKPIVGIAQLYVELKALGFSIQAATSRPERLRLRTFDWFSKNGLAQPAELHMRGEKNDAPIHEYKRAVAQKIGPKKIWLAIDDDAETCLAYAELGICTLMVAR